MSCCWWEWRLDGGDDEGEGKRGRAYFDFDFVVDIFVCHFEYRSKMQRFDVLDAILYIRVKKLRCGMVGQYFEEKERVRKSGDDDDSSADIHGCGGPNLCSVSSTPHFHNLIYMRLFDGTITVPL